MKKSLNVGLFIVACAVSGSVYAGDIEDQLLEGAQFGDVGKVQRSLERGADPNFKEENDTPLSLAVISGWTPIVKMLLKYGADPNTFFADSPVLNIAATRSEPNYVEMVKSLLQYGADPTIRDGVGKIALDVAAPDPTWRPAGVTTRQLLQEAMGKRRGIAILSIKEQQKGIPRELYGEIAEAMQRYP